MSTDKYLDKEGLIYVWSKIKAITNTKVDKVNGKGLSTNDYTTTEKNKLEGIETGATKTIVDATIGSTSTNPVQNKAVYASLNNKVDKVSGKGLSTNDYTTTEKTKLSGIEDNANNYVLPIASASALGGIKVGDNLTIGSDGKLSAVQGTYTLPTASASILGGIKVGTNLSINGSGVLSATDTTYSPATTSSNGLMTSADKTKLDGIEAQANKYVHPSHTSKSSGLYKVTVDSLGHVTAATSVAKSDITALGIPAQDTTYNNATTSTAGLMSAADKTKLDGIDVSTIYKYKGSVATVSDLPSSGVSVGDVYNVETDGMNYAWTGTAWDALGGTFTIVSITNAEIDEICT